MGSGVAGRFARRRPSRRVVLAYHNVLPDDVAPGGDRSLHIPRERFAAHLDLLAREARVVPLADLLEAPPALDGDRRPVVAVTFDDAYSGAVTAGVAELAARGLPATICVPPAFVGGRTFWWDALASPGGDLAASVRDAVLDECRGDDTAARSWAAARNLPVSDDLPPAFRCAGEPELRAALGAPGLTVASHTWSHRNLARLEPAEAREELERPRGWLARFGDGALPVITYPYGLHSAAVRSLAGDAGYRAAFRVDGGALGPADDRFALPRLNVPAGLSPEGLLLRLAGLVRR